MVFRAVVFTFVPTAIELVLVCFLLARIFQPIVAILVVATFAAYVLWTAQLTRAAAKVNSKKMLTATSPIVQPDTVLKSSTSSSVEQAESDLLKAFEVLQHLFSELICFFNLQSRQQVNELDNLTTGKAVDALLNYETVKLFNNERLEVIFYDSQPSVQCNKLHACCN